MRLRVKFGSRELEYEDDTPRSTEEVVELANIARAVLLQPGEVHVVDDHEDDHPHAVTSTVELGFRGNPPADDDEDWEDDEDG